MNQDILNTSDIPTDDFQADVNPVAFQTAGQLLRHYREMQGVQIDILASSLKVPVSKLASLENDRLDELPDTMFARALTLAVCRILKMDATPVLALLPGQDVSRLAPKDERGIDFPLQRPSFLPQSQLLKAAGFFTPMRVVAVLVLMLALALAFWPDIQVWLDSKNATTVDVVVSPATQGVAPAGLNVTSLRSDATPPKVILTPVPSMVTPVPVGTPSMTQLPASATGAAHAR
jgi:cytoskeleton protein RodZ